MFKFAVAALLALTLGAPAAADWKHELSGISLPDEVGDLRKGEERKVAADGSDIVIQYGSDTEPATVFIYRSSHPNPALWFERTRIAMIGNVGQFDTSIAARSFTLGPTSATNGLRAEFAVTGKGWKSTAVAMAQHGEWLIKARVTSSTLDPQGAAKRLDSLLAAMRFAATPKEPPLPLIAPIACTDTASFAGKAKNDDDRIAMGAALGIIAFAEAHPAAGAFGLAGKPQEWCRQDMGAQARSVTLFRKLDGTAWTALVGDAGISIAAHGFPTEGKSDGAAVFLTRTGPAMLVATYDALPDLQTAGSAAMAVLAQQRKPLATVGFGQKK